MERVVAQAWVLASLISVAVCWGRARIQADSWQLRAFTALLAGPGVLALPGPSTGSGLRLQQQSGLVAVGCIGGLSAYLFLLTCLFCPRFTVILNSANQAWSATFAAVVRASLNPWILGFWLVLNLALPALVYRGSTWRCPDSPKQTWSDLAPVAALPVFVLTLLMWAVLGPIYALDGCIDLSDYPRFSAGTWITTCLFSSALCGAWAWSQGASPRLFTSLGILLGLGAWPLTWLATRDSRKTLPPTGTGISPNLPPSDRVEDCRHWAVLLACALPAGLLAFWGQVFLLAMPWLGELVHQLHSHYYRQVYLMWSGLVLVGPSLAYLGLINGSQLRSSEPSTWIPWAFLLLPCGCCLTGALACGWASQVLQGL